MANRAQTAIDILENLISTSEKSGLCYSCKGESDSIIMSIVLESDVQQVNLDVMVKCQLRFVHIVYEKTPKPADIFEHWAQTKTVISEWIWFSVGLSWHASSLLLEDGIQDSRRSESESAVHIRGI